MEKELRKIIDAGRTIDDWEVHSLDDRPYVTLEMEDDNGGRYTVMADIVEVEKKPERYFLDGKEVTKEEYLERYPEED